MGRAWRAPNVNERYSQGVHHGTAQYEIGDPSLGVERTWNVDGTLRHSGQSVNAQVSAYRNTISGYIYLEPRAPVLSIRGAYPAFEYQQTNAIISGIEARDDSDVGRRAHDAPPAQAARPSTKSTVPS